MYKILMICPWSLSKKAGAEILALDLAYTLAKKGNEVHVLCFPDGSLPSDISHKNLHVLPLLRRRLRLLTNSIVVLRLALRKRYDVVHAHFVYPAGIWALAAKLLRIPIVITSHGWDIQLNRTIGYGARQNKLVAFLIRLVLKLIDTHVVVSRSMINDAVRSGSIPSKIQVIYNGVNLKKIYQKRNTTILQRYQISDDELVILYLSRLHPKKRPEDLLIAFSQVANIIGKTKLIIAGKGEEENKLRKLISKLKLSDKVILAGFVSESEKWVLLKRCDIFVLPSMIEGLPLAIIEAMACGKPVIATNIKPFSEIIRDGVTGILVPVCSPERIAEAIIYLALNPEKRKEMGKKARETVREKFSLERMVEDTEKVYEGIRLFHACHAKQKG